MKKQEPVKLDFGVEMYDALKEASKGIFRRMGILCDSIEFDDDMKRLLVHPTREWYLIQLGYDACKILNNVDEVNAKPTAEQVKLDLESTVWKITETIGYRSPKEVASVYKMLFGEEVTIIETDEDE